MTGESKQQTLVGDVSVLLRKAGDGKTALFLHGAGGVAEWAPFMQLLSQEHQLLVPDHPWYGESASPEWLESVSDLAFFYLDFLAEQNLTDVHLIGNSLGGWIAAEMAIRDTRRLASLTLLAPAGIHLNGVPKGDIFLWSPEETVRNLFADEALAEMVLAQVPDETQLDILLKNRLATARYAWEPRLYNPDLHKWLHRIDIPTLILWGDSDRIFPSVYADAFANAIPGSRMEVFENCGHLPQVECTDRFLAAFAGLVGGIEQ